MSAWEAVLGILGYGRVMDVGEAIGYGPEGRPDFWITRWEGTEPNREIHVAFRDLGRATYRLASEAVGKPEVLKQVSEILKRAAREIQDIPR